MNCMKCGREIAFGQVFCKECLAEMERHPVKADTPVILPNRNQLIAPRRPSHSKKILKAEERIVRLRRLVMIQTLALILVLIAFVLTVVLMSDSDSKKNLPTGTDRNQSTRVTVERK